MEDIFFVVVGVGLCVRFFLPSFPPDDHPAASHSSAVRPRSAAPAAIPTEQVTSAAAAVGALASLGVLVGVYRMPLNRCRCTPAERRASRTSLLHMHCRRCMKRTNKGIAVSFLYSPLYCAGAAVGASRRHPLLRVDASVRRKSRGQSVFFFCVGWLVGFLLRCTLPVFHASHINLFLLPPGERNDPLAPAAVPWTVATQVWRRRRTSPGRRCSTAWSSRCGEKRRRSPSGSDDLWATLIYTT